MMNIPTDLKYTKEHEWVRTEGGMATVGITDHAQSQLGDIVFVDVQTAGETLEQGDMFGAIEAVKTVADAYMPLSGEVTEVNAALESEPQSVNRDPYGRGWLVRIRITRPEEIDSLLDAGAYAALI
jgi:glycine cleavage system H protein